MPWDRAVEVWDALMVGGRPFDIHPAGMLALDVARVEAGLLLIDVDFHGSKKALIESQKYSPFEMGLGRLVQLDAGPFVGRAALARGARRGPRAADRRPRDQLAGRRERSTSSVGLAPQIAGRRVARRGAGLPERPPGRPRDDHDVVAGAEEADRARDGRRAALRRGHARSRSRSPSRPCATASRPPSSRRRSSTRRARPPRRPSEAVTRMASGSKEAWRWTRPERELCALMEGYLEGRIEAFDALHAASVGRLRGYLLSQCRDAALADDLLQDTFMQIHRSRRTYEPGRPVTPWVFAIARHVYLMKRRSAGRRMRFEEALAADAKSDDVPRDDLRALVEKDEVRRALRPGARGSARGAAAASRRRLELRRDCRAAGHSRQRREDARVPRHEEDEGAVEVSAPDDLRDGDRARSEAGQAAAVAVRSARSRWCRSPPRSCSPSRRCTSSAPTSARSASSAPGASRSRRRWPAS